MLSDRPDEQMVLFKEIVIKKISVREAERISRKIAFDKIRNKDYIPDPEIMAIEEKLQESLGTRVHIEKKDFGGHIKIDFFSHDDLRTIFGLFKTNAEKGGTEMMEAYINTLTKETGDMAPSETTENTPVTDDRSRDEVKAAEEETELYNIKNFSV